ncbi:intradiol ring-cleavage dioxygenase family protein [Pleurotus pulmonarius]
MAAPSTEQTVNVSNGIPPPSFDLPYPETPETITENLLKLGDTIPNTRQKFLFTKLVGHLHQYIKETSITTEEWMSSIQFLTQVGQTSTPIRQEFILLSDVLGVSALVDLLNTPAIPGATANSVLGPFHTDDAPLIENGESIASEGKGKYLYIEGRVLDTDGTPVPGALIETWQADETGLYDTQYADREGPDLRGLLKTDKDGKYGYRAVVPEAYPIPGDGPVGELLMTLNRHNMRPAHIHITVEAPGYRKLTTALYPEGNVYLRSDCVFGVKESLVVKLVEVENEKETRRRGFPKGNTFKLLTFDIVLVKQ